MRTIDTSASSTFNLAWELSRLMQFLAGLPLSALGRSAESATVAIRCAVTTFDIRPGQAPHETRSYRIHSHARISGFKLMAIPRAIWEELGHASLSVIHIRLRRIPSPPQTSLKLPTPSQHVRLALYFVHGRFVVAEIHDRLSVARRFPANTPDIIEAVVEFLSDGICGKWQIDCAHQHDRPRLSS